MTRLVPEDDSALGLVMKHAAELKEQAQRFPGKVLFTQLKFIENSSTEYDINVYIFEGALKEGFLSAVKEPEKVKKALEKASEMSRQANAVTVVFHVQLPHVGEPNASGVISVYLDTEIRTNAPGSREKN